MKANRKHCRLLEFIPCVITVRTQLIEMAGIAPSTSFDLLWFKVAFYDQLDVRRVGITAALTFIDDKGLLSLFERMPIQTSQTVLTPAPRESATVSPFSGGGPRASKAQQMAAAPWFCSIIMDCLRRFFRTAAARKIRR